MTSLLEVQNLTTQFSSAGKTITVVDDVSFSLNKRETLAIVGESGSGKSVTSLSLMRLLPKPGGRVAAGKVILDGVDILKLKDNAMYDIRGAEIAMIFQEPMNSLNPVLTIGDQITEVLRHHQKIDQKTAEWKAVELLKKVGFARAEAMLNEYPHQLSGGMRQRVMIAIALSCNPKVLIADEPTTALDVTVQAQILDLMRKLSAETDAGVILITHDLGVVAELADKVVVMYAGQVVEQASVTQLFDNPTHPYTWGLMKAVPHLDDERDRLSSIPGNVPSPHSFPKGCRFSTRCDHVQDICREQRPPLVDIGGGQQSRCFIASGEVIAKESAL